VKSGETTSSPVDQVKPKIVATNVSQDIRYDVSLDKNGVLLTPFAIASFEENPSANSDKVRFKIANLKQAVDKVSIAILAADKEIRSWDQVPELCSDGVHTWSWDGFNAQGRLDTTILKGHMTLRLTAQRGDTSVTKEFAFSADAEAVDWIDLLVDAGAGSVQVEVRPGYADGGVVGSHEKLTPTAYADLLAWAQEGIQYYWSRGGVRGNGIAEPIMLGGQTYKISVMAVANKKPHAAVFNLIDRLDPDFGRSTSLAMFRKVVHSAGYYYSIYVDRLQRPISDAMSNAEQEFKETAAHEFGHLILNAYEGNPLVPTRSWSHKGTSTVLTQSAIDKHPTPLTGEVDVMHYFSSYSSPTADVRSRTCAVEDDVKALIWLARLRFRPTS